MEQGLVLRVWGFLSKAERLPFVVVIVVSFVPQLACCNCSWFGAWGIGQLPRGSIIYPGSLWETVSYNFYSRVFQV